MNNLNFGYFIETYWYSYLAIGLWAFSAIMVILSLIIEE